MSARRSSTRAAAEWLSGEAIGAVRTFVSCSLQLSPRAPQTRGPRVHRRAVSQVARPINLAELALLPPACAQRCAEQRCAQQCPPRTTTKGKEAECSAAPDRVQFAAFATCSGDARSACAQASGIAGRIRRRSAAHRLTPLPPAARARTQRRRTRGVCGTDKFCGLRNRGRP